MNAHAGDAVMNMAISQMVFASSASASNEVLHDRRKVMVRNSGICSYACQGACVRAESAAVIRPRSCAISAPRA